MTIGKMFKSIMPFVKPYKWLVVGTLAMTFIGSLMAQVNAVVLDWTVDKVNALIPLGEGQWGEAIKILTIISGILLGKEILSAVITFAQRYYGERMRILVSRDMAQAVIEKMLTFRVAFFAADNNEPGKLQTRIDRGVESLSNTVKNFFIDILPQFTSAILALVLMYAANVYVGLVATAIVPIYFWITFRQAKKLKGWRRNMRNYREAKSHGIMNIIESITVIKSFNRERIEGDKQLDLQNQLTQNQMETRRLSYLFDGLKSFVEQIGTVLIIILTAYLVLSGFPGMTIGKIMYHVMLFNNVSSPIRQLHRIYDDMNDALIYAEGYFDILNNEVEVEASGTYRPEVVKGEFEIKDVDFTYPNGTKALHNINMKIAPNKITAFVGLSGAGKSTIVNLLDKFYEPDCGTIMLDGVDIKEWDTEYLRENIGLVLQKNHIFDGSIEENIKYGNPRATHEDVIEAAKKAYLYDQVVKLPGGFETKATMLSGGQQQRVAIARACVANPKLILADEPTGNLDSKNGREVMLLLQELNNEGTTIVMVTHSQKDAAMAQRTIDLFDGKIVSDVKNEL